MQNPKTESSAAGILVETLHVQESQRVSVITPKHNERSACRVVLVYFSASTGMRGSIERWSFEDRHALRAARHAGRNLFR